MGTSFKETSYNEHENHWKEYTKNSSKATHAQTWFDTQTIDFWRHNRMHQCLLPLIESYPNSSWATIGDGRFGTEAHFLQTKGVDAVATDISDHLLIEALNKGFISKFSKENAESLSFSDNEFDFTYCKEAYHHFPRPTLALYEMLRVSKKGIVLTEPKDATIHSSSLTFFFEIFRNFIKRILGKKIVIHDFEDVGNYIFSISEREIEKVALGLNLRYVAFKSIQDYYIQGVEYEKAEPSNKLFKKIKRIITLEELLNKFKLRNSGLLTAIIFLTPPDKNTVEKLQHAGYIVKELPKNPYI